MIFCNEFDEYIFTFYISYFVDIDFLRFICNNENYSIPELQ